MKIVLDNIIYSKTSQGGVSNYWFELSKFLLNKEEVELLFYEEEQSFNFHRNQLIIPEEKTIIKRNGINNSIKNRLSKVKIDLEEYFLFHSSYYRPAITKSHHSEVTTVHDFTHNYYSSLLKRVIHNKLKFRAINKANGIICISKNTYNDLIKFCPPKKNQKIEVIYNGVSNDYFKITESENETTSYLTSSHINRPYLLYVGGREGYKNFSFVAKLFNEIPDMQLVIVGSDLKPFEKKLFSKESIQRVVLMKNLENKDLNRLYNSAFAFLYPSSYEGFGIPIIEAMRAGCPVISLNNSSIIEVSGDAAILLNELNIKDFKKHLVALKNSKYKEDLIEKGIIQSHKFSWQKCCKQTYEFYKEIYDAN